MHSHNSWQQQISDDLEHFLADAILNQITSLLMFGAMSLVIKSLLAAKSCVLALLGHSALSKKSRSAMRLNHRQALPALFNDMLW